MASRELVAASTRPLLLAVLMRGESYGYELIREVRELSSGHLEWSDGMLYPVLHRLARERLVSARWGTSPEGRRRRYYRLTERGQRAAEEARRSWELIDRTLRRTWRLACQR